MRHLPLLFLLCCNTAFAQNNGPEVLNLADTFYQKNDYAAALPCFLEAREFFNAAGNWEEAVRCLYKEADCFYELGQASESLKILEKQIPFYAQKGVEPFEIAKTYLLKGIISRNTQDLNGALMAYENAIEIYKKIGANHRNVAYAYKQAGQIYLRRLDYEKTIAYFEKGLLADTTKTYQASLHALLADTYLFLNDNDKAIEQYEQGKLYADSPYYLSLLQKAGGEAFLNKKDYATSEDLLLKSLKFSEKEPDLELWKLYYALSQVYTAQNQAAKAEVYFQKAFKSVQAFYPEKNREVAKLNCLYGDFLTSRGKPEAALEYYHRAQIQAFRTFDEANVLSNPKSDDLEVESWQMTASAKKGAALLDLYKNSGSQDYLRPAVAALDLSIAAHSVLKNTYGSEKAKLYLGDYNFEKFETAIEANFLLFEKMGEKSCADRVFELMEQSKAEVLEEKIEQLQAIAFAGLPDSVARKEENLRWEIAGLKIESKAKKTEAASADALQNDDLLIRIHDLEEAHSNLLKPFRANFAHRSVPKNRNAPAPQQITTDTTAFLEFFYGDNDVYLFVSTTSETKLLRLGNADSLTAHIASFLSFFKNSQALSDDVSGFSKTGLGLYRLLFPAAVTSLLESKKEWIIVPDGLLNFLPFDALLTENYDGTNFSKMPFLIKKRLLRLSWSAVFLQKKLSASKHEWQFFAPVFEKGERGLSTLKYSAREKGIAANWRSYNLENATTGAFKKSAAAAEVLHLSTHACADEQPRIEFFDKPLLLDEIYALVLPADLVVLSACQTSLGTLQKGEGVMSLARGFSYAGAGSLISSLWSVNEQSTADMFMNFYKHVAAVQTKAQALRHAKLEWLDGNVENARKSPFYWAGFVFYGADGPLYAPPVNILRPILWSCAALLFLFLLGMNLKGRLNSKK